MLRMALAPGTNALTNIRFLGADLALLAEVARPQEPPARGETARARGRNANSSSNGFAIVEISAIFSTTANLPPLHRVAQVHAQVLVAGKKRTTRKMRRKAVKAARIPDLAPRAKALRTRRAQVAEVVLLNGCARR